MAKKLLVTAAIALSIVTSSAIAETISVDAFGNPFEVFHFRDIRGVNSVGLTAADRLTFGLVNVEPDGYSGTTVEATQAETTVDLIFVPTDVNPKQFGYSVDYNAALTGSWQFDLTNGSDTLTVNSPSPGLIANPDFATDLVMTSQGTTPTIRWVNPVGINEVKVSIYDLEDRLAGSGLANRIFVSGVPSSSYTFDIPPGLLLDDHLYSVAISTHINYAGGTNPSGSSQVGASRSITRAFFDFSTGALPDGLDVYLPSVDTTGSAPIFNFDNEVLANLVSFYDPIVATGYDYMKGIGDPNFGSVILPDIGDGFFELYLHDGTDFAFEASLAANDEYFFGAAGVEMFRILGIEPSAGLDPTDAQAFVTGLSFIGDGRFTGSMTAILTDVNPVPLPAALPLFGTGLALIGFIGWRRKRKVAVAA